MAGEGGYIVKKSMIFASCGCISLVLWVVFLVFVICTNQMHSTISDLCARYDSAIDMQCTIRAAETKTRVDCDHSCVHDYTEILGGAGASPGLFGVGEWNDEENPGFPKQKKGDKEEWNSLVRPGKKCVMSLPSGDSNGAITKMQLDCPCEIQPIKVEIATGKSGVSVEKGCTVVTTLNNQIQVNSGGALNQPCLWIPRTGKLRNEIAIQSGKDEMVEKCKYAMDRFGNGGHYFIIYVPIMILWCWCGLISCVGYADQKYQAFARFKNKKGVDKMGDPLDDGPSAAVMAAQEWAQTQAMDSGGVAMGDTNLYGNPSDQQAPQAYEGAPADQQYQQQNQM